MLRRCEVLLTKGENSSCVLLKKGLVLPLSIFVSHDQALLDWIDPSL